MNRARVLLCAVGFVMSFAARGAETVSVALKAGQPAEVVLDSPLDDGNYADPRGYSRDGASTRSFIQKLTLTNTGAVPLTGALLVVNGRDWSSVETLRASLALPEEPRVLMERLFTFWSDHVSHAHSGCRGLKEPLALLNFWGYALCADSTISLTRLAMTYGVPARQVPLNGHVAAEYFYDDGWHIFDSDQIICYFRLDNAGLASSEAVRADPFLALRAKGFGRHATPRWEAMALNASLHEYLNPEQAKPRKLKSPVAPVRADTLLPGEQMIVQATVAPEVAVGRTDLKEWGEVRETALRVVEWVLNSSARRDAAGRVSVATGFPILRAVNHTTGEIVAPPVGEAVFEITLGTRTASDQVSIYCQRSRASLPLLGKGRNSVLLAAADARGAATLAVEWESPAATLLAPKVEADCADSSPVFRIRAEAGVDTLWWQICAKDDFAFVPPHFDAVMEATKSLSVDPMTATFFNPGQPYFLRMKARRDDVWGEWSAPLKFQVEKPARPAPVMAAAAAGKLQLSWPDAGAGTEYLVFGSNRLDFVPEPFAAKEIAAMRGLTVELMRTNKNLIAVVAEPRIELDPAFRFYRVIARRGGRLSVPGDLVRTPPPLAAKLPPAQVLQTRWTRTGDLDDYYARELPLP